MSKFVVSARKYRPQTFDDVIGQNHVASTLKNALQTDKLAHAFLFCGPRGVGKTTCARILAKVINCENSKDKVEPCNECSSCKSFNDNASFNIIELDAASNNSVDHIRTLIEQVRFQPQHGTHKVFIIDEVHMLSSQAFNAFLKTLEEPPPYAIFILATTEKHKIIPTILSRCQIFDFKRIQVQDIIEQLKGICKQEGIQAEKEALHLIAQKADGAMRDALSIFDKIASSSGDTITYKDVISNLNILDYEYYFKIIDAFLREDLPEVLLTMDKVIRQGFDAELFIQGLSEHMRTLLVCKHPDTVTLMEVSETLQERYLQQAGLCKSSFILSSLNLLNQCDINLARAKNKRLYAEVALSKMNYLSRVVTAPLINEPLAEKKTDVISSNKIDVKPSSVAPSTMESKEVIDIGPKEKIVNKEKTTPSVQIENAPSSNTSPVKRTQISGVSQQVINTPSFNLDDIKSQIKKEEEAKQEARGNLNLESIKNIWNTYCENNPSKSVQTALRIAEMEFENKVLSIYVPSPVSKDIIFQEMDLLEKLRNDLGTTDLIMDISIDRNRFPDFEEAKPKKLLSNREKYDHMLEKNPDLATLKDRFSLKVDTE